MLDLLFKDGAVIDGAGTPARTADIGIRDGKVVKVGKLDESARSVTNISGLAVCPGFVDIHTHFDAQVFWDSAVSPSCFHGVTTVIGGNCGFTIAPMLPQHSDYIAGML